MDRTPEDLQPVEDPEQDELYSINDIGPKYAEALHRIGVHHLADFAQYTEESLAQELREKTGVKVTPDRIRQKNWLGQAKELDLARKTSQEPAPDPQPEAVDPPEEKAPDWRERGSFSIWFYSRQDEQGKQEWQTKVYHEGGAGQKEKFEGQDPSPWVNWILKQVQLPVEAPKELKITEDQPAAEPSLALASAGPTQTTTNDLDVVFLEVDVNPSPIAPTRQLEARARFSVSGAIIRDLEQSRSPYQIEFYTINLDSQASTQAAYERKWLDPKLGEYEVLLDFAMPPQGRYELQTILFLPGQGSAVFQSGPVFKVV